MKWRRNKSTKSYSVWACYSSRDATKDATSCVFKCHFRPFVLVVVIWRVVIIQLVLLYALKCHDGNSFSWRTPFVFVLHEVERVSVLKLKGSVAAVATFCSVVLLYDRYPTQRGQERGETLKFSALPSIQCYVSCYAPNASLLIPKGGRRTGQADGTSSDFWCWKSRFFFRKFLGWRITWRLSSSSSSSSLEDDILLRPNVLFHKKYSMFTSDVRPFAGPGIKWLWSIWLDTNRILLSFVLDNT